MKCPRCQSDRWIGVLHTIHRKDCTLETYFCKNCYIEFVLRNGRISGVYRVLANGRLLQIS
ncbi:hypothetical protein [Phosphitispora fastidiosa]|uniref:hypothetical protein n=1 Tax=Phosphitispora fastidiosa TaxID=2837202 RepID=UPI001E65C000|nr:hypothetical protein [Phosphitispora fastidiosa]MBU7006282.1 transposase-like protein [Phosphitispora fastidiosa]